MVGEPVQGRRRRLDLVLCVQADQDHEHGDQWHGHDDDDGAEPVGGEDARTDQQGNNGTGNKGGQILGVVVVEAVEPAGDQYAQRAGPGAGRGAAVVHHAGGDRGSQLFLGACRGPLGNGFLPPGGQRPEDCSGDTRKEDRRPVDATTSGGSNCERSSRGRSGEGSNASRHGLGHQDQACGLQRGEKAEQVERARAGRANR